MRLRLVLDTNVWLDWLVFDDPGVRALKAAVAAGEAEVFTASDCQQELERVIRYPLGKATLDSSARTACLEEYRRVVSSLRASPRDATMRLPVCRDPADQKFLELARDCEADFLVTKDRALLVLARRQDPSVSFRIVTPGQLGEVLIKT
jgi:uncharacterized protein